MHTELSKDAIDYSVEEDYRTHYTPKQNESVELVTCPYFTTSVYDLTENMTIDYSELDSFVIYICMEGTCTVTDGDGNSLELQAGESILFPATTKEVKVTVEGHVKFLENLCIKIRFVFDKINCCFHCMYWKQQFILLKTMFPV